VGPRVAGTALVRLHSDIQQRLCYPPGEPSQLFRIRENLLIDGTAGGDGGAADVEKPVSSGAGGTSVVARIQCVESGCQLILKSEDLPSLTGGEFVSQPLESIVIRLGAHVALAVETGPR
jgi:hypothetical protein